MEELFCWEDIEFQSSASFGTDALSTQTDLDYEDDSDTDQESNTKLPAKKRRATEKNRRECNRRRKEKELFCQLWEEVRGTDEKMPSRIQTLARVLAVLKSLKQ